MFFHRLKCALFDVAQSAIDRSVLRKSVVQPVADHAGAEFGFGRVLFEVLRELLIGVLAVEVVRVNHGERGVDFVACGAYCVSGAPGLFAAFGDAEAFRQVSKVLIRVGHLDLSCKLIADCRFKRFRKIAANHEHHFAETRADRVEHGIVEYGFAIRPHRV